jgi:hypothetical protein
MTDDLRSTLEAAAATEEAKAVGSAPAPSPAPSPAPAPASEPAQAPAEQPDVETGAPEGDKPGEPPEGSPENQPKDGETDTETGKDAAKDRIKADKAPQSWKPTVREKWATLDPEVKQEVIRREREVNRVMSETSSQRRFVDGFRKTVAPFAERFKSANVPPERAIASLLYVDHTLATGSPTERAQMLAKLVTDYGVDIQLLDDALSGIVPNKGDPVADRVQQLLDAKLKPFNEFLQQTEEQKQQAVQRDFEQAQMTVKQMEEDTEKYPHFDTVREDIADLIEINSRRGVYLSLPDAYNRAVRMNPEASAQVQAAAKRTQAQKANESAQRALGASLSITGAPSGVKTEVPASDLRGTIEQALINAGGR